MCIILSEVNAFIDGKFKKCGIVIEQGKISAISDSTPLEGFSVLKFNTNSVVIPGFADVHVHLREPGFSYKETIKNGTLAAAAGGYSDVCAMPNLNPVPDSIENLKVELECIERDATVNVHPYASITKAQQGKVLSDFEALAPFVIGFSDDGKGVQSEQMMLEAMKKARSVGKPIVAHCEQEDLLKKGWSVHDGNFARKYNLIGNSPESEWRQLERDLNLVRKTGCRYHACHISTAESVHLIREAKKSSLPVSCETAPHYLLLNDEMLEDDGRFRMNPPIRSEKDRIELINGLADGTIDCIATDHAPHSKGEKSGGIAKSINGISGLECAFNVLYEGLVLKNIISLETLVNAMSINPRKLFGINGGIKLNEKANLTVLQLGSDGYVDSSKFYSMGKSTPFDGCKISSKVVYTLVNGNCVYNALEEV